MTVDVSTKELWNFYSRISNVIEAHRVYVKSTGVRTPVVVRWDAPILRASRVPSDVFSLVLLDCLKAFEELFIKQRHVSTEVLYKFVEYCQRERNVIVFLDELDNANGDAPLSERHVKCTIRMNGYTFTYWNNAFLPYMSVETST